MAQKFLPLHPRCSGEVIWWNLRCGQSGMSISSSHCIKFGATLGVLPVNIHSHVVLVELSADKITITQQASTDSVLKQQARTHTYELQRRTQLILMTKQTLSNKYAASPQALILTLNSCLLTQPLKLVHAGLLSLL